jgi:DNA-binding MarR family transcriptional regulator
LRGIVRFDERNCLSQDRAMSDDDVFEILRAYPQIYFACHVEHRTRGKSPSGLTSRDAGFLAHLDDPRGTGPAALARHVGISGSTLSAALARLAAQGLVRVEPDPADGRRRLVFLTEAGRDVVMSASVLDPARVAALLARLDPAERRKAVEGLKLLAAAARAFREGEESC